MDSRAAEALDCLRLFIAAEATLPSTIEVRPQDITPLLRSMQSAVLRLEERAYLFQLSECFQMPALVELSSIQGFNSDDLPDTDDFLKLTLGGRDIELGMLGCIDELTDLNAEQIRSLSLWLTVPPANLDHLDGLTGEDLKATSQDPTVAAVWKRLQQIDHAVGQLIRVNMARYRGAVLAIQPLQRQIKMASPEMMAP